MKFALSLLLLLCTTVSLSGQDLSGHWTGQLFQNNIGWYDFELQLTALGDSLYTGTSYISSERGSGTMSLRGFQDEDGFHFQESRIRDEHWTTMGWYWCLKSADLELIQRQDSLVLTGRWKGSGTCKPGHLHLAKFYIMPVITPAPVNPELSARQVETRDLLHVNNQEVEVDIWDHEQEDGDIASITLNGEVVLKDHLVTVQKHTFKITLAPGKNLLVLYAENLGTRPPNTAALTIHYDGITKTVVLNSDKTKSEAIEIMH